MCWCAGFTGGWRCTRPLDQPPPPAACPRRATSSESPKWAGGLFCARQGGFGIRGRRGAPTPRRDGHVWVWDSDSLVAENLAAFLPPPGHRAVVCLRFRQRDEDAPLEGAHWVARLNTGSLLRNSALTIKFTYGKCAVQWLSVYSGLCVPSKSAKLSSPWKEALHSSAVPLHPLPRPREPLTFWTL